MRAARRPKTLPPRARVSWWHGRVRSQRLLTMQVKSGLVYEGIFHTADLDSKDVSIVLKMAKTVKDPSLEEGAWAPAAKPVPSLVIYSTDLVQVIATDVRMGAADVGPVGGADDAGGFGTDAAISRGRGGCAGQQGGVGTPPCQAPRDALD